MRGSSSVRAIVVTVVLALCISLAAWTALPGTTAGGGSSSSSAVPLTAAEAAAAEEMYSPVLLFSTGERIFPVAVDHFIAHCHLTSSQGTVQEHPNLSDLGGPGTSSFSLDHLGGSADDGGAIGVYEGEGAGTHPALYVRTAEEDGRVIIQYWLFYVFNQGTYNSHEGDWEMVQVILERGEMTPSSLTLSRHHSGSRTAWADLGPGDLDGTHPVVLVSRGSHAIYLPSASWRALGDVADGNGLEISPGQYDMVSIGRPGDGAEPPAWLLFQGTWGERTSMGAMLGTDGPPGPMFREGGQMWAGLEWGW